jgi:hypothetical protein
MSKWQQARKAIYEQWLAATRFLKDTSQLELFAPKQRSSITIGGEEFIWRDGQLYKAVKHWEQCPTPDQIQPAVPYVIQNPSNFPDSQVYIGDNPNGYVIWSNSSNGTAIQLGGNNQMMTCNTKPKAEEPPAFVSFDYLIH